MQCMRGSTCHGACAVRVLGLFRRPFHPEPVDHLLENVFKYLTRCARGADTPPEKLCAWSHGCTVEATHTPAG